MTEKQIPQLKKRQIHAILKALSPKREIISPKKGHRAIPRGISPDAAEYITNYLNEHLMCIVMALEESLDEVNSNPNSYYQQHRYDMLVAKTALKKIKK